MISGELVADRADCAAERVLDPLRDGCEIGFAIERSKYGAAHQSRAADAGQNRAGKPLHRNATAIDNATGAAIDRERRLIAEVGGRVDSGSVWTSRPTVVQSSSPALAVAPESVRKMPDTNSSAARSNRNKPRCRVARTPVNDDTGTIARIERVA